MALGSAGQRSARLGLVVGAWVTFACLTLGLAGGAAAAEGEFIEAFGPDGTSSTVFERPAGLAVDPGTGAVYVADSNAQTLYKFDASGAPLDWGGAEAYIAENRITGLSIDGTVLGQAEVAVDPNSHVVYLTSANKVRAFEANGEPHEFTALGGGVSELSGAVDLNGVTVDNSGNIYTSDGEGHKIRIYKPSGELITEFTPGGITPGALAVAQDGTLYVADIAFRGVYAFDPSRFPVTAKTTYGIGQRLNDQTSTSIAVDPVTQYVYIGEFCPQGECQYAVENSEAKRVSVYDELGNLIDRIGTEDPGALRGTVSGVGISGTKLYAAVFGELGGLSQVSVFETLQIPSGPPTILGFSITNLTSSSAVLRARINPNTFDTTYWFEYGLSDCAATPGVCTKVPADGASAGSGHQPVAVSVAVTGLAPGTKYFTRVVAENSAAAEPEEVSRTFTTPVGSFDSPLGDERVWELVTPAEKFGGVVTNANLLQADPNGEGIAFQTRGSLVEDPEGNRALEPSAVLAQREGASWKVGDLVPRHTEAGGLGFGPEFKLFSQDLGQALLEPRDDTPLSPEASERAPYLRTNTTPPSYRPLVTSKEGFANVEEGTVFGGEVNGARNPVAISGANASLTHVVISAEASLVPNAEKRSIYLWSNGLLEPVSELPGGGPPVIGQIGSGALSVKNAISEDGSRVFWSPGGIEPANLSWPALYLRDTQADKSFRIDVPEAGVTGPGLERPAFMAASADGSVVFFTDSQQLTADASPKGRDLYRCEIGEVEGGTLGCTDIEDLTAPLEGSGENGDSEELSLGMSEDGSAIYFVAGAILDAQANEAGDVAAPGGPNLYVWQEGQGVRFIGLLSPEDRTDWGDLPTNPIGHEARVAASSSPGGRYLAFMSQQNLTTSENDDPTTGQPVEQAFVYDAVEESLRCVSCNLNGATEPGYQIVKDESEGGVIFPDPQGLWSGRLVGATLPEASEGEPTIGLSLYRPRTVLDNGRAFFNSASPLTPGDSNGTWDVYQYEPIGLGTCSQSAANGMVAVGEAGCVSLISSGTDDLPSVYMDASATGNDAFFATFAPLSALDTDKIVDVYDARVDGFKAVREPQPTACAGESCQPSGSIPGDTTPSSATFNGAGNVKQKSQKHCKKGQRKVKRNGKTKCVKKKQQKKHRKSARTKGGA